MPLHDWTRVKPGTYHNFHFLWLATIENRLNTGILPQGWFAMAEQRVGGPEADVLTLSCPEAGRPAGPGICLAPPQTAIIERAERVRYARKTHRIAIHHDLGTIVAVLELVSPGNKDTRAALRSFARKSAALLRNGIHLSVIDPFPPGKHDPRGIHQAIWNSITQESACVSPGDKPLIVVAYQAGEVPTAYVEPCAVGLPLPNLPLFLDEELYVSVPLEETYQATWNVLPQILRDLLAPPAAPT
jgi:hypothetical protein